jgi:hypothetical protein
MNSLEAKANQIRGKMVKGGSRLKERTMSENISIVDRGRGPQLSTSRLTVMDVFYYLHRGYDFEFIQRAMPALTRSEFDVVTAYVHSHRDELADKERRIEEYQERCRAELKAKGLYKEIDHSIPPEVRLDLLRARMEKKILEKNGDHVTG